MSYIKKQLSEWLNLDRNSLNEIEIEDIEFAEFAQRNINKVVAQMLSFDADLEPYEEWATPDSKRGVPCKGFWVEDSKDLILYVLNGNQSKAIVVPQNGWMIKDSITIN